MKSLENFVECHLDLQSAEDDFVEELNNILHIPKDHIKKITVESRAVGSMFIQVVVISMWGNNHLKSEDLCKIKNLTVVTPNTLEIEYGEIHL